MVKMHRFVHVKSLDKTCSQAIVRASNVPVVTKDAIYASQFQGYVMRVTLSSDCDHESEGLDEYGAVMILARDLYILCNGIMGAGARKSREGEHDTVSGSFRIDFGGSRIQLTRTVGSSLAS